MKLHQPKALIKLIFGAYKEFVYSVGYLLYFLPKSNHFDCVLPQLIFRLSAALEV